MLSKYFELFIVNFTADQFQLSLFRGEGTLQNIGEWASDARHTLSLASSLTNDRATHAKKQQQNKNNRKIDKK